MQSSPPQKKIRRISSILDLPTCILVDILSRLPVNSIFDCTYVCKAWYDLLSDPYFATVYRKRPPYISILLSQQREYEPERDCFPRYFQLLELQRDYKSCQIDRTKLLKTAANPPKHKVQFLGGCNGLICLSHVDSYSRKNHHVYICNPILEEYVKLPQSNMEGSDYMQAFGFGCHPTTGQYKVLRIITKGVKSDQLKAKAEVFTLGVDHTWRNVGDAPFPNHEGFCKIPLNGALHWLVEVPENPDLIYSFDIKEEKVVSFPTPIDHNVDQKDIHNVLGVLRNCLCLFSHIYSPENSVIVIWSMRKYGVVDSWTKEIVETRRGLSSKLIYRPIATWRDGEMERF